jgi:hypothetical protein
LCLCLALLSVGLLGSAAAGGVFETLAANAIFALAVGILMPFFPYLVAARSSEATRNRALGWMATAIFLGIFVNPPLVAALRVNLSLNGIYLLFGAVTGGVAALAIGWSRLSRGSAARRLAPLN